MCKFDYFFHSCGHTQSKPIIGPKCDPANWCSKPGPLAVKTWNTAFVLPEVCEKCAEGNQRPIHLTYTKFLAGVMVVLERDIRMLKGQWAKGEALDRARVAVELLGRIVERYPECCVAQPSREEMQRFVAFAARSMQKAKREARRPTILGKKKLNVECPDKKQLAPECPDKKQLNPECAEFRPSRVDSVVSSESFPGAFEHQLAGIKHKSSDESYDGFKELCKALGELVTSDPSTEEEDTYLNLKERDTWECDICGPDWFCMNLQ